MSLELYRNIITNEELKEKNAKLQEKLRLVESEKSEIQLHIKGLKRKLEKDKILLPQVQTNTLQEEKMWRQEEKLQDQKEKIRKQEEKLQDQEEKIRKQEEKMRRQERSCGHRKRSCGSSRSRCGSRKRSCRIRKRR
nr:golgin subfamily A member 6-like protein 7 isoform X1 [Pongo abelii]XP_054401845.1 golgin subfamily A member 6-like protein 7 isoform X1 [Pongo abelii]